LRSGDWRIKPDAVFLETGLPGEIEFFFAIYRLAPGFDAFSIKGMGADASLEMNRQ
jgi:hypothetical protein